MTILHYKIIEKINSIDMTIFNLHNSCDGGVGGGGGGSGDGGSGDGGWVAVASNQEFECGIV